MLATSMAEKLAQSFESGATMCWPQPVERVYGL